MFKLDEKVILITGGASGIGKSSARLLGESGAKLAICDINKEEGNKVIEELEVKGIEAKYFNCDVSNPESVQKTVSQVIDFWGKIDVAFLNAGIEGPADKLQDISYTDWKKTFSVNVDGIFLAAKFILPLMEEENSGNIIITSSNLGMSTLPGKAAYSATKAAIIMLAKSIAVDYKDSDIRANVVCPGPVKTPLVTNRWEEIDDPVEREKVKNAILSIPQLMEVEEVAKTVLFLASDASKAYNGETFVIDNGARAELAE